MKIAWLRKFLDICDVLGWRRTFVKLLKMKNKPNLLHVLFSCASVVSKNELELLRTLTKHNFNYLFIILHHPGIFLGNLLKNIPNVTYCMCIYCHYRHLRTCSRLDMQRFHQIDEFMVLRHPWKFNAVQYKQCYKGTIIPINLSFQSQCYIHWVI